MSNGGVESVREHEQLQAKRKFNENEFPQALARIAVAQICESAGFQTFQQSALETLSDLAVRYIQNIGKNAHFYANLAGRTSGNIFDIIQGLEDLDSGQGFAGASDVNQCLTNSGVVRDIIHYVGDAEDIPFAYSLHHFPVVRDLKRASSFMQIGKEPPDGHIPAWLPAFPEPWTDVQSEKGKEKLVDFQTGKIEKPTQHRKTERSLLSLQHFSLGRLEGPSLADSKVYAKEKQLADGNPFLLAPLRFGEKEVSSVTPPTKLSNEPTMKNYLAENHVITNHVPVLETFAPAIEAMKNRLCDSGKQQKELSIRRPLVQFKIGIPNKSLHTSLDFSSENKGLQKIASWSGKDDDKNDKKRRAEKILKESMEKMQELAQL